MVSGGTAGDVCAWLVSEHCMALMSSATLSSSAPVSALALLPRPGAAVAEQPALAIGSLLVAATRERLHVLRRSSTEDLAEVSIAELPAACSRLAASPAGRRPQPAQCQPYVAASLIRAGSCNRIRCLRTTQQACASLAYDRIGGARAGPALAALYSDASGVSAIDLRDPYAPQVSAFVCTCGRPLLATLSPDHGGHVWCCEGECKLAPQRVPELQSALRGSAAQITAAGCASGASDLAAQPAANDDATPAVLAETPAPDLASNGDSHAPAPHGIAEAPALAQTAGPSDAFSWDSIKAVREQLEAMCASDGDDESSAEPLPTTLPLRVAAPDGQQAAPLRAPEEDAAATTSAQTLLDARQQEGNASPGVAGAATTASSHPEPSPTADDVVPPGAERAMLAPASAAEAASATDSPHTIMAVRELPSSTNSAERRDSHAGDAATVTAVASVEVLSVQCTIRAEAVGAQDSSSASGPAPEFDVADAHVAPCGIFSSAPNSDMGNTRAPAGSGGELRSSSTFVTLRASSVRGAPVDPSPSEGAAAPCAPGSFKERSTHNSGGHAAEVATQGSSAQQMVKAQPSHAGARPAHVIRCTVAPHCVGLVSFRDRHTHSFCRSRHALIRRRPWLGRSSVCLRRT